MHRHVEPGIGLAHARLSIIDLVSGDQPIHNESRTAWVVFNGEIFNYVELRASLEAQEQQGGKAGGCGQPALAQFRGGVQAARGLVAQQGEELGTDRPEPRSDGEVKEAAVGFGHDLATLEAFEGEDGGPHAPQQLVREGGCLRDREEILNRLLEHVTLRVSFSLNFSGPMLP